MFKLMEVEIRKAEISCNTSKFQFNSINNNLTRFLSRNVSHINIRIGFVIRKALVF